MKKRILLIEDESDLVMAVKFRLELADYDVSVAADGQEGLDKVKSDAPDLILLDLMLPKVSGYKVAKALKSDPKYKDIPVIVFTARVHESKDALGVEAYITKPYEIDTLLDKIKELLKT
jgi:DNA-binding response OmpR family regulator